MENWYNNSGQPFGAENWLITHHLGKVDHRRKFAESIISSNTRRVVDLGCGPGLWLDIFNDIAPPQCELIGIDLDIDILEQAKTLAESWTRPCRFTQSNLKNPADIPEADIYLVYNMFPYFEDPLNLLSELKQKLSSNGLISIRQYDGALIRFGPMDNDLRFMMNNSLEASVGHSKQFRYYDLDRTYAALTQLRFEKTKIEFEEFQRNSPFTPQFQAYFDNTVNWVIDHVNDPVAGRLKDWLAQSKNKNIYFVASDLVATLS